MAGLLKRGLRALRDRLADPWAGDLTRDTHRWPTPRRLPTPHDREAGFDAVLVQILEAEDAGRPRDSPPGSPDSPSTGPNCSSTSPTGPPCDPAAGRPAAPAPEFPGYEVVRELGRGGMGVVYEARQLDPPRVGRPQGPAGRPPADPGRAGPVPPRGPGRRPLDHPGIVPVYDIGEADGVPFYTMRLAPGGPLSRVLDRFRADPQAAAALVAGLARAVHHAHERGVLHRDLKPSNILLDADGRGLVGDFGLVRDLADPDPLTRTASWSGPRRTWPRSRRRDGAGRSPSRPTCTASGASCTPA